MAHSHKHSHKHNVTNYNRAFAIGTALNVGFVVVEALFGFLTGSLALLADAGHNLSVARELDRHFGIEHSTIQIEIKDSDSFCVYEPEHEV